MKITQNCNCQKNNECVNSACEYAWDILKYMFRIMQAVVVLAIFIIIVKHFF